MRALLLALLLLVSAAPRAWAQGAAGYLGVSATVLPAPATVQVSGDADLTLRRGSVGVSTGLRMGGTGPATLSVTTGPGATCEIRGGAASPTTERAGDAGRGAGRLWCALAAGTRGGQVPVTIVIVPAT